jgi:hypothetical protein
MLGIGISLWRSAIAGQAPSFLDRSTAYLGGIEPYHFWDFTTNRALFAGEDVGALANTPGWSFTRATVGTAENVAGEIIQFASGELRRTNKGLWIEPARTNLFLNSAVGATQDITVAAAAHTLSFLGTGTITLTGVSTAGPLIGTGANNRVTLTFTPTAGTLTCTVSGSCTNVQLEAASGASSWIPTAGSSVTRAADLLTVPPGIDYPCTLWIEFERLGDTGAAENLLHLDDGANERATLRITNADLLGALMVDGGVTQGDVTVAGALSLNTNYKAAAAFNTDRVQACRSGTLGTVEDTTATLPSTPSLLRIGSTHAGTQGAFMLAKRAALILPDRSNANLQTIAP